MTQIVGLGVQSVANVARSLLYQMTAAATTSSVKAEANTIELCLASITTSVSATSTEQDISVLAPLQQVELNLLVQKVIDLSPPTSR
jgi:hypothetical protein